MDFGEHLVAVREQLEVPLPIRVPFWRLVIAVGLETSCLTVIYLFRRDWRSLVQDRNGLVIPKQDFDDLAAQFDRLNGRRATDQQIEQAHEALKEQTMRRVERYNREMRLWLTAVHRGMFIGTLLSTLPLTSIMMCLLTGRLFAVWLIMVGLAVVQSLGAFICLHGWHRP